jgi:hypothetical protein
MYTTTLRERLPAVSASEVFYVGERGEGVMVRGSDSTRPLNPRLDLGEEAAAALGWGADAAASRLALALLADALGDDARALRLRNSFNRRVVAVLPDRWTMTRSRVVAYADMADREELLNVAIALTRQFSTRRAA